MNVSPKQIDALQGAASETIIAYWHETLEKVGAEVGHQMAATGMFMVALEAFRAGMGDESAADLLEGLAVAVRTNGPVSMTIDRGTEH